MSAVSDFSKKTLVMPADCCQNQNLIVKGWNLEGSGTNLLLELLAVRVVVTVEIELGAVVVGNVHLPGGGGAGEEEEGGEE